ncbi:MAG TPA: phosphatase PAP2 family protein [Streptosporangiaceae bacterium]|nr:phosphatase PAP2 family protein [Streptosporangiaceae bacterium]
MNEPEAVTLAPASAARVRPPWLVPGGLLLILVFLTANVLAAGPVIAADRRIRAAVLAQANAPGWRWIGHGGHAPAQLLTGLGNNQVAVPILVLCALLVAARHRSLRPLLAAAAGVILLLGIVTPAKILTDRAGPGLPPVPFGHLGVFPSGHTTTSGVCLALATLLLAADLPARARRAVIAVTVALCFLVGVALIWCDYHWFSDVAAGWALTPLIVMASLRLAGLSVRSGNSRPQRAVGRVAEPEKVQTERLL